MKKLKNEIKCIVFDLDGTIVDSEKVWTDKSLLLNKKYSINMDDNFRLYCCGRSTQDIVNRLQKIAPSIDAAAVRQEWVQMVKTEIETNGVPLKEGFLNLLNFLKKQNIKLGLATGSNRDTISNYFKLNNLNEHEIFDQIVTVHDVNAGKPKPDIYKKLCKDLGLDAKNCLCIEDSPNGAKSAWRAGLNVILVPDVFVPTFMCKQKCCAILNNLNEVLDFISQINLKPKN